MRKKSRACDGASEGTLEQPQLRGPCQCGGKFAAKLLEIPLHPAFPADQDMIVIGKPFGRQSGTQQLAKTALHPVSDHGVSNLLGHCNAEALALPASVLPLGETLVVTGKGNKQRVVAILPVVREAVAAYAAQCPWPLVPDQPLFRGAKGGALNHQAKITYKQRSKARRCLPSLRNAVHDIVEPPRRNVLDKRHKQPSIV